MPEKTAAGSTDWAGAPGIIVPPGPAAEGNRAARRGGPAVSIDFSRSAVRERDARTADADIELEVLGDVVARLEIDVDRRLVVGLGDTAEDVIVGDATTEGEIPGIKRGRRRSLDGLEGHIRS